MRAFAILSALGALCSVFAAPGGCNSELNCSPASPALRRDCVAEMCGNPDVAHEPLKRAAPVPVKTSVYGSLTNAQRLARGLPLKAPTRRLTARTGTPSSAPTYTTQGHIQVRNAANGNVLGYVSKTSASTAYFINSNVGNALTVSVTLPIGSTSGSQLNLAQIDGPNTFPYFGLVQGRDSTSSDITSGSFNYLYMSATDGTSSGSPPQSVSNLPSNSIGNARTSESAVWTVDLTTGAIFPQWINTDGSAPTTQLFSQSNALYAGGDSGQFVSRYPSPVTSITLSWVTV